MNKVIFIISHRYYRNYKSYIKLYVDNIQKFYINSFIIIVDNNSKYLDDIKLLLNNYNNLVILINNSICKFEIGAYKIGIKYIFDNNLLDNYEYYVFTQDTFIIKNKFDFNNLTINNVYALAINTLDNRDPIFRNRYNDKNVQYILSQNNLLEYIDNLTLCFANSFVLHNSKIIEFYNIIKDIIVTNRYESEESERYLSGILYKLNNYIMYNIDGDIGRKYYSEWNVNLEDELKGHYFYKCIQQKTENTPDD